MGNTQTNGTAIIPNQIEQWKDGLEDIKCSLNLVRRALEEADQNNKHLQDLSKRNLYSASHCKKKPKEKDDKKRQDMFLALKLYAEKKVKDSREAEAIVAMQSEYSGVSLEELLKLYRECGSVENVRTFMGQECNICYERFPKTEMVSMLYCECQCCRTCTITYFEGKVRESSIYELTCPMCPEPRNLETDDEVATNYFANLQLLLKSLLKPDVFETFMRKDQEMSLRKCENFKWCGMCQNGMFIENLALLAMACSHCGKETCWKCQKPWERSHGGRTCEEFMEYKRQTEINAQTESIEENLRESGIQCPKCKVPYELARGGCMHFTCRECRFEFCCGCGKEFHKKKCRDCRGNSSGLHAHHPRNCLFYLRDLEPDRLEGLLQQHGIDYRLHNSENQYTSTCPILEQKEDGDGEEPCRKPILDRQKRLCRKHYCEHLGMVIRRNHIDPVDAFDVNELKAVIIRAGKVYSEHASRDVIIQMIRTQIPL